MPPCGSSTDTRELTADFRGTGKRLLKLSLNAASAIIRRTLVIGRAATRDIKATDHEIVYKSIAAWNAQPLHNVPGKHTKSPFLIRFVDVPVDGFHFNLARHLSKKSINEDCTGFFFTGFSFMGRSDFTFFFFGFVM